jgi:hypothetical protein
LQRSDGPFWILVLVPAVQFAEEVFQKLWIAVFEDSFACQSHQIQLVVDVMHGQQMGSGGLFGGDVGNIGTSDAETALRGRTTACTLTALFNGPKVLGVYGVA